MTGRFDGRGGCKNVKKLRENWGYIVLAVGALVLYLTENYNYLLFHGLAEMFSIVIAFTIFIVAWNGRKYSGNTYLLLLGVAYLFIGFLDLLHTFGYHGMGVFHDYDYYANQLWVAARSIEAVSLIVAFTNNRKPLRIAPEWLMLIYALVTAAFIYSIFFSDIFPVCYVEGVGQTPFKIYAEYVINVLLLVALLIVRRRRRDFSPGIYRLVVWSIIFTIISELAFTFYVHNYGLSNMLGHYAKIASFYLIYLAVTQKNIVDPYDSIFNELTQLNRMNSQLFSIISHDLRSPFGALSSLAQDIHTRLDSYSKEELKSVILEMSKSIDHVHTLTENLLNWAYTERSENNFAIESLPLRTLLEETVGTLSPLLSSKDLDIRITVPDTVFVDADRDTFLIVLRNVLSNAIKFSYPEGQIEVESSTESERVELMIRDHGVGTDIKSLSMNSGLRSTRGTAGEKGTGLGLVLVNRYVERNGGAITFAETPGGGVTTLLSMPFSVSGDSGR